MEAPAKEYIVRNCLGYAYDALRSKERLIGDTTESYYESYFQRLLESLGPPGKKWELIIPNSEVESFYLGGVSPGEFRLQAQRRWVGGSACLAEVRGVARIVVIHVPARAFEDVYIR